MATTAELPRSSRTQGTQRPQWIAALWRSYLFRKTFKALFTVFVVVSLTFFLIRLLPGNPVEQYINRLIVEYGMPFHEARDQAASLFAIDLEKPLLLQYIDYLGNLLQGNLGVSILSPGTPVSSIILRFLPWTLFSVGVGLITSFSFGIVLGLFMAYRRESPLDHVLTVLASILSSVPDYLIGILIIVWLGVQLKWLPIAQMRGSLSSGVKPEFSLYFFQDAFFHAALPISTYILTTIGTWMLSMKSNTLSALEEDYVTVARARGLPDWRIATAYVGRNAILPLFTQLTIAIGFVMGGSVLIETIFQYQGIGGVLFNSVSQRDYSVMQGVFLVITLAVVFANFLADILYSVLDPRIKLGGQE